METNHSISDKVRLARNLRIARISKGLSQKEAAKKIGRSRQTLGAWEREDEDAPMPGEDDLSLLEDLYGRHRVDLRYGSLWEPRSYAPATRQVRDGGELAVAIERIRTAAADATMRIRHLGEAERRSVRGELAKEIQRGIQIVGADPKKLELLSREVAAAITQQSEELLEQANQRITPNQASEKA